jgi:predicted tellurium resistance membrane protein TerC
MEWITDPQVLIAFLTLVSLEIVLGIDNIIFISLLAGKLRPAQQPRARLVGLALAMLTRIALLATLSWMAGLTSPMFAILGHGISARDLVLIVGGLFLLAKSTHEIHSKIEEKDGSHKSRVIKVSFHAVIIQIVIMDVVFSLDSVITAIGMANRLGIMIAAIIAAVVFMMFLSGSISALVDRHPTIRMLALSFLLLIGFTLILEGFDRNIPKGYIYFAMAFSVFVEILNSRIRKRLPDTADNRAGVADLLTEDRRRLSRGPEGFSSKNEGL